MLDTQIIAELEKRIKSNGKSIRKIAVDTAQQLGCSERHVYRLLKQLDIYHSYKKAPSHKGSIVCGITEEELKRIIVRKTGGIKVSKSGTATIRVDPLTKKNQCATWQAIDELYQDGLLQEEYNEATINRIIRARGASLRQQRQDKPHVDMISLHPNHVWMYDTTWCAQVYLDSGEFYFVDTQGELYRNKPVLNVSGKKVIRYVIVDHFSSLFYVQYYLEENAYNFQEFFWKACRAKDNSKFPLRGVPKILVTDKTSQVSDSISQKILERLDVKHLPHFPQNPRAKGSVETMMAFWERVFESRLRFQPATSLKEINRWAEARCIEIANTRLLERAEAPRAIVYNQNIKREHIREMVDYKIYRQLAHKEKDCKVWNNGIIKFKGNEYRIGAKYAGQMVKVEWSPYEYPSVQVNLEDGKKLILPPVEHDAVGRRTDRAGIWGEKYVSNQENDTMKTLKRAAEAAADLKEFKPFDTVGTSAIRHKEGGTADGNVRFMTVQGQKYEINPAERFYKWETAEEIIYQAVKQAQNRGFTDAERAELDELKIKNNGLMSEALLTEIVNKFITAYREKIWAEQVG
jgi:hypothetical protein